jgi:hypothetical protein
MTRAETLFVPLGAITPKGQRKLDAGRVAWRQFTGVMSGILAV